MAVRDRIEGPPLRKCPIRLRQTSFLAVEKPIRFRDDDGQLFSGFHRARFGEIEERGSAVTHAGRKRYDELREEAMRDAQGQSPEAADAVLAKTFDKYRDCWDKLRKQSLVCCEYRCSGQPIPSTDQVDDKR